MFAEQPSVKLCCQLCCNVFKDPVITTCGVRLPSGPGPHSEAPSTRSLGLWSQAWPGHSAGPSVVGTGWGQLCSHAPIRPLSPQHTFCRRCALKSGRSGPGPATCSPRGGGWRPSPGPVVLVPLAVQRLLSGCPMVPVSR